MMKIRTQSLIFVCEVVKENTVVKEQKWSVSEEEIRPFSNFDILDFLSIRNLLILVVVRVLRKSIGNWRKLEAFQTKKSLLFSLFFILFLSSVARN